MTRGIPVIFISARDETDSLVQGFAAGGVDYITKPVPADEVLTRVGTHLKISRLARELTAENIQLERGSAELTQANEALRREMRKREQAEDALESPTASSRRFPIAKPSDGALPVLSAAAGRSARSSQDIRRVQNFGSVNVLITGESGTGKGAGGSGDSFRQLAG